MGKVSTQKSTDSYIGHDQLKRRNKFMDKNIKLDGSSKVDKGLKEYKAKLDADSERVGRQLYNKKVANGGKLKPGDADEFTKMVNKNNLHDYKTTNAITRKTEAAKIRYKRNRDAILKKEEKVRKLKKGGKILGGAALAAGAAYAGKKIYDKKKSDKKSK
jgi:hypothetical protein